MGGKVLRGWSTKDKRLKRLTRGGTVAAAKELGALVAADLAQQGTGRLVFDRGGYRYHGRVEAFADALRAAGVQV
jgi:large subunit ribosomal protein L18